MSAFEERELNNLARSLARLVPRPAAIDRDALLFEAGKRSVRAPYAWIAVACGMTLIATILAVALLVRPEPATVIRYQPAPVHAPASAPVDQAPAIIAPEEKPVEPSSPSSGSLPQSYGGTDVAQNDLPGTVVTNDIRPSQQER